MEIKDTELNRFEPVGTHILKKTNEDLTEALDICNQFTSLEEKYNQVSYLLLLISSTLKNSHCFLGY